MSYRFHWGELKVKIFYYLEYLIYLEAVKNGNVNLHQCLVLPEGGGLSGVQAHLVCNLLENDKQLPNVIFSFVQIKIFFYFTV